MIKLLFLIFFIISSNVYSFEKKIIVASTTSTYDSGLLNFLNDKFKEKFGIKVQVLAQGTGQALRTAKDGNIEIVIVHHKKSELDFMDDGYGLIRYDLMYNDYIIVGPKNDKTKCQSIKQKLNLIFSSNVKFISRGDDSGTHKKELELLDSINVSPENLSKNYINVGQGMGNTLLIANEMKAYTLVDRSTWISFNKKENLKIICEFKPPLLNQYGIIIVNPLISENLDIKSAQLHVNWLISNEGRELINNFKKKDQQLFFFNYK